MVLIFGLLIGLSSTLDKKKKSWWDFIETGSSSSISKFELCEGFSVFIIIELEGKKYYWN